MDKETKTRKPRAPKPEKPKGEVVFEYDLAEESRPPYRAAIHGLYRFLKHGSKSPLWPAAHPTEGFRWTISGTRISLWFSTIDEVNRVARGARGTLKEGVFIPPGYPEDSKLPTFIAGARAHRPVLFTVFGPVGKKGQRLNASINGKKEFEKLSEPAVFEFKKSDEDVAALKITLSRHTTSEADFERLKASPITLIEDTCSKRGLNKATGILGPEWVQVRDHQPVITARDFFLLLFAPYGAVYFGMPFNQYADMGIMLDTDSFEEADKLHRKMPGMVRRDQEFGVLDSITADYETMAYIALTYLRAPVGKTYYLLLGPMKGIPVVALYTHQEMPEPLWAAIMRDADAHSTEVKTETAKEAEEVKKAEAAKHYLWKIQNIPLLVQAGETKTRVWDSARAAILRGCPFYQNFYQLMTHAWTPSESMDARKALPTGKYIPMWTAKDVKNLVALAEGTPTEKGLLTDEERAVARFAREVYLNIAHNGDKSPRNKFDRASEFFVKVRLGRASTPNLIWTAIADGIAEGRNVVNANPQIFSIMRAMAAKNFTAFKSLLIFGANCSISDATVDFSVNETSEERLIANFCRQLFYKTANLIVHARYADKYVRAHKALITNSLRKATSGTAIVAALTEGLASVSGLVLSEDLVGAITTMAKKSPQALKALILCSMCVRRLEAKADSKDSASTESNSKDSAQTELAESNN